jgi:hypothetical protein
LKATCSLLDTDVSNHCLQANWTVQESSDRQFCAAGLIQMREASLSSDAIKLLAKHSDLVLKLKEKGGLKDVNGLHLDVLSRILVQQQQRGLDLPEWLDQDTQKQIRELAKEHLQMLLTKPAIRSLLVGPVLQQLKIDLIRTALDFEPEDALKSESFD